MRAIQLREKQNLRQDHTPKSTRSTENTGGAALAPAVRSGGAPASLLPIPVIGCIARGDQRLSCSMRGSMAPAHRMGRLPRSHGWRYCGATCVVLCSLCSLGYGLAEGFVSPASGSLAYPVPCWSLEQLSTRKMPSLSGWRSCFPHARVACCSRAWRSWHARGSARKSSRSARRTARGASRAP